MEPPSLDDAILTYIDDYCQSVSSSGVQQQSMSIPKKQIQKHYDSIVNEYDTTKKNVKHALKRLLKRNVIVKNGKKNYSYIQPQQKQSSREVCTIIETDNRKRQIVEVESSEHESAATAVKRKRINPKCSVDGCDNQVQNRGLCIKHGAKKYKYTCKHEGCHNCARNGFEVCIKHGATVKPRKKCEREGCNNNAQRLGVCKRHGAYA